MDFLPTLSPEMQQIIRIGYAILMLCTIAWTALPGIWFFRSARYGGYGDRHWTTELLQNPFAHRLTLGLWITACVGILLGYNTVWCAAVNLAICWYYFVRTRWNSLLRGMGAPGFFCYWMGAAVFVLEMGRYLDPTGRVLAVAVLVLQVDYALIQLCAGSYKSVCGYSRNAGMQLGLANPFWGHHWRFYKKMPPDHPVFRFLNQASFRVQIVGALLMLFPPTRWIGAAAIAASFLFVMTQIRLGFLLPKVMLGALLFIPAGSALDRFIGGIVQIAPSTQTIPILSEGQATVVCGMLIVYLVMLPLAKFCQWYNFLEGKTLNPPLQRFLESWCNHFGIIIWRVFSVDVINFFVRVYQVDPDGQETEYTCFGKWSGAGTRGRYIQVAESIALTCVFTTLKYHPADSTLFTDKLVRYARTVPCPEGGRIRFEYHSIDHTGSQFEFVHRNDFVVEPVYGSLESSSSAGSEVPEVSPVRASAKMGSYLPT
jgi:hypothetical protein